MAWNRKGEAKPPPPSAPVESPGISSPPPEPAPAGKRLYRVATDPKPAAIVVHCSDPRFQPAFEEFLTHELGLAKGQYIPIVVGGGAGVLGHPEQLPKEFKFMKERLEHYHRIFPTAKRIVLINHEGCRYYQTLKSKTVALLGPRFSLSPEHAREDLSLVGRVFQYMLAHLGYSLELYYAKFADPDKTRIEIEKVVA